MKIVALNLDIEWKNPQKNIETIEEKLATQSADLFLLPEMFTTGFCMDAQEIADRQQTTLQWMQNWAKNKNSALAGSASVEENGQFFNRFYFVKPTGEVTHYDKKHLFSYSGEHLIYTAGKEKVIVEYLGFRILLLVCYDLRFPVFSRNQENYDMILYVANWPKSRIDAWKTLLKARAIENQSFVFGVNRTGTDGNQLYYPESSFCFFADGSVISTSENQLTSAYLELQKLNDFREKFAFLKDRDIYSL